MTVVYHRDYEHHESLIKLKFETFVQPKNYRKITISLHHLMKKIQRIINIIFYNKVEINKENKLQVANYSVQRYIHSLKH